MLDFVTRPIRVLLGAESEVVKTAHETHDIERETLRAVDAIEHAQASIEKHVAVIESLATSVDPLRASVDRLTDTMQELVAVLGPLSSAEHEAQKVGRLFHRHRDAPPPAPSGSEAAPQTPSGSEAPPPTPSDTDPSRP
jgi:uncharacterized protein YoxC